MLVVIAGNPGLSQSDLAALLGIERARLVRLLDKLEKRGLTFDGKPHLIARMDDHDLWMAFFKDPDGHTLALMHEAPKGYAPIS